MTEGSGAQSRRGRRLRAPKKRKALSIVGVVALVGVAGLLAWTYVTDALDWEAVGRSAALRWAAALAVAAALGLAFGRPAERRNRLPARWAVALAGAVALPVGVGVWGAVWTLQAQGAPTASTYPSEWGLIQPFGLFADASDPGVVAWRWAPDGRGATWRETVLLSPPYRLTGECPVPADGRVRLFVALPHRGRVPSPAVTFALTAADPSGETVAEAHCNVPAGDAGGDRWQEINLDLSGAQGPTVAVTLKAHVSPAAAPEAAEPLMAVSAPPPRVPQAGPNCLIILVDAMRSDRLHCYGFPLETSPTFDRLAEEGVLFERAISACSWTVPSVASLFTGTYVSTHGMADFRMPYHLDLPTLASQFQAAGARTAAVSANASIIAAAGYGAGFEEFVSPYARHEEVRPARWVTDEAIGFLRRFKDQRFFIYLHYMEPHSPYEPPPEWRIFGSGDDELYLGEIRSCDHEIGPLLAELDSLGLAANTLVILMADHGEAFGEHGARQHGNTVFREEVQVPLILRWPGRLPAGRRVPTCVRTIDIFPTVAELAGLPVPRHVEGESLGPLLDAGTSGPDRPAYSELHVIVASPQVSLEEGHQKLILYPSRGRRQLYDIQRDPDEHQDLSATHPDVAAAMEHTIREFLRVRGGVRWEERPLTEAEKERLQALGYLTPTGDHRGPWQPTRRWVTTRASGAGE